MVARTAIRPSERSSASTFGWTGGPPSAVDAAEEPGEDEADGEDDEPDLARGEADVGHAGARREARGSRTWPARS